MRHARCACLLAEKESPLHETHPGNNFLLLGTTPWYMQCQHAVLTSAHMLMLQVCRVCGAELRPPDGAAAQSGSGSQLGIGVQQQPPKVQHAAMHLLEACRMG